MSPQAHRNLIDYRLYRIAFIPALIAVVVVMFSLEGAPDPLEPGTLRGEFDGARAAALARQIVDTAPDRTPGSEGDSRVADLVHHRFGEVTTGAVSEQRFAATYEDNDVALRNVVLTLPGDTDSTVVVVAARDAARSPAAASSAAATGILLELANTFRISHRLTYVLASVSGSEAGAAGVRELVKHLPDPSAVDGIVVISQPGAARRRGPFVVVELRRDRHRVCAARADRRPRGFPTGRRERRTDLGADPTGTARAAVRPRRPGAPDRRGVRRRRDLSRRRAPARLGRRPGRRRFQGLDRRLRSRRAVDRRGARFLHHHADPRAADLRAARQQPRPRLGAGGARAGAALPGRGRRGRRLRASAAPRPRGDSALVWALACCLPFIGALVAVLYGLAIVGLVPRPPFPFDPGLSALARAAAIAFAVMLAIAVASACASAPAQNHRCRGSRRRRSPGCGRGRGRRLPRRLVRKSVLGAVAGARRPRLVARRSPARAARASRGCRHRARLVPVARGLARCRRSRSRPAAPWTFTIMVADGQIGLVRGRRLCLLAGALAGAVILALRPAAATDPSPPRS